MSLLYYHAQKISKITLLLRTALIEAPTIWEVIPAKIVAYFH